MKSLFFIGVSIKEQHRIKSFLDKEYTLFFNPSVHNAIDILRKQSFDMLLYDADNVFPLKLFLEEVKKLNITSPVTALSKKVNLDTMREMLDLGVDSMVKVPCSKNKLKKEIGYILGSDNRTHQPNIVVDQLPGMENKEIDTWVALRKDAVIVAVRHDGIYISLPTALPVNTRVYIKNPEICKLVGYKYTQIPRLELVVGSCTSTEEYLYNVDLYFFNYENKVFHHHLNKFIDNAVSEENSSNPNKTIVVAEVDEFTRTFYQVAFEGLGYDLSFVEDGEAVLRLLKTKSVKLLVVDLQLHRLGGTDLIHEIKSKGFTVPIIIATGESKPEIVNDMIGKVQDYLLKPFDVGTFLKAAKRGIEQSENKKTPPASVNVHLKADALVAFRDKFRVIFCTKQNITFQRSNPISPNTTLMIKKSVFMPQNDGDVIDDENSTQFVELLTGRCEFNRREGSYQIMSQFKQSN